MKTPQPLAEMVQELEKAVSGEVYADEAMRQIYSTDASDYRMVPAAVVVPRSVEDISAALAIIARHGSSVIPRGGGSNLSGQTVGRGVVLDHSKYLNRILEINPREKWAWCEAGVVLDRLNAASAPHQLMVGPDPASSAVATLGGMIGNNSTGSHSVKYGMIADHILALEVVLADGSVVRLEGKDAGQVADLARKESAEGRLYREIPRILKTYQADIETRYPKIWRNVAGYGLNRLLAARQQGRPLNLAHLVAGSEGTLAYMTKVKLGLVDKPRHVRLMILHFDQLPVALDLVPKLLEHDVAAVELMNHATLKLAHEHGVFGPQLKQFVQGLPGAILIVELAGQIPQELAARAEALEKKLRAGDYCAAIKHCITPEEVGRVWGVRKAVNGLLASRPGDTRRIGIIDDPAVPVPQMTGYCSDIQEAGRKHGVDIIFDAHVSAGCMHLSPNLNLKSPQGIEILRTLCQEIVDIAIAHDGTSTGEHGDGIARSHFIQRVYGPRLLQAFREVKAVFDPDYRLNPGKIIDAPLPWDTQWLRYFPGYQTPLDPPKTYLDFAKYGGFAGLVEMCNGQGVCRSQVAGSMCPSYRVTRDEQHSTRGRANILRAALTGELGPEGLTSKEVHAALDLCVECKACLTDCSTRVDMAKLKYEFLAQYQQRHGVPLRSRMFGSLALTDAVASKAPGLANWLYQNRAFRKILDQTLRIDRRRELPRLAAETFQHWFKRKPEPAAAPSGEVILWDDCHLSYHEPDLGVAAVSVLEAAGFKVKLIEGRRCCGRPMISKGLLKQARTNARHNIRLLKKHAAGGIPIIGVEPSCITCFRDEYPSLLQSEDARLVAQGAYFFEEFITDLAAKGRLALPWASAGPARRIKVHTHCYQKALGTAAKVVEMLNLLPNTTAEAIDSGCCGMAGSFGYEKEHYDISMAMGEQALFPVVRKAAADTVIAAAGTSCRQQIKDGTGRHALHPIVILAGALAKAY